MKAVIKVSGKSKDVNTLVGLALEYSILESFEVVQAALEPSKESKIRPSREVVKESPFKVGDTVSKKYQTKNSFIARFSTGTVKAVKINRGGWSAEVTWDDPKYDNCWLMSSALRLEAAK